MRMLIIPTTILMLSVCTHGNPAIWAQDKEPGEVKIPEKVRKNLGDHAVDILSKATKVECFRLNPMRVKPDPPKTIGDDRQQWVIVETGKAKGKEFAAKVRALVFDEATSQPSGASGFPANDIAFRLSHDQESVTLLVDFSRNTLTIITRDADGKQIKVATGGFVLNAAGGLDQKGELRARVVALALDAFPDDEAFKAMKR